MTDPSNDWKDLVIQDQLLSKDKEITALFEQLSIKDEQIAGYQKHYSDFNASLQKLSAKDIVPFTSATTARIPWALASCAAVMFLMLSLSYVNMRNDFITTSNESIYLSERIDMQRDVLAKKSTDLLQQRAQIALLHSQNKESNDAVATAMREIDLLQKTNNDLHLTLREYDDIDPGPVEIATE